MLKSVLYLPQELYDIALKAAEKKGLSLVDFCQQVCSLRLDDVRLQVNAKEPLQVDDVPTGLEA